MNNEIAGDFTSECYPVSLLKHIINNNIREIEGSLVSGLMYYSENARYTIGSLEILDISQLKENYYSMSYCYQWHIFNPCLDINTEESLTNAVTFIVHPEKIVFDIINNDRPSTADEL
ncbi:hypothetical protein [Yersinia aleksiciae]|uniref:Uncharacterized protein n=1 Tax=Yersinia aleksiciae TaxID=263819 RepID=A0ABN4H8Z7_YERAE|nr:hypothetical protein [Yersinia aleksiciae]AKP34585.1 hypothetical protein ACZ76_14110 [Yersinia aleksiciae]MDA5497702.1 hypothetical protein [Yersinia aleksiciae]MDN0122509.1 hypothetical protein [Yersinia aleksiciae]NIK98139.1 hypothetical protein [Yersinia aleksiciae]WQC69852.1 hypothetical protein N0K21_14395 [Yersinia aleksiciae]